MTVSVDAVQFIAPGRKGDNLIVTALINRAWRSSMEIGITIDAEAPFSGDTRRVIEGLFTFVALDDYGRPTKTPVPEVAARSWEEAHRFEEAGRRQEMRLQQKRGERDRLAERAAKL